MTTFILNPQTDTTGSVPKYKPQVEERKYVDREYKGEDRQQRIEKSSTVYVGNLSCYTNEYQIHELFSRCGSIKRVIMGLDRFKKTPCGFCFVEFDERESALRSISYLSKSMLDNRPLSIDIDAGFEEGRQFGRGKAGGQIGDERRKERDQILSTASADGSFDSNRGDSNVAQRPFIRPRRHFSDNTRFMGSLTMLALIGLIFLLCIPPEPAQSFPFQASRINPAINRMQRGEGRKDFEQAFARLLVNVMKTAKPSLMQAFMKATLEDKKLKEIAIGIFFNATDSSNNNNDD